MRITIPMTVSFDHTIDWSEYWQNSQNVESDDANASAAQLLGVVSDFLDWTGPPASYADVGCGGGAVVRSVAERYDEAAVVGYDAAEPVVEANRRSQGDSEEASPRFEQAVLPHFEPERQFDIVSCFFTLCYVPDTEAALRALYDAVTPGGYLVCTYHNRFAAALFRQFAANPQEHIPADSPWDPDTFADRFELVLREESTLSYRQIHDILGRWPQSIWSVVDVEPYGARKLNPIVYVPK